MSRGAKLLKEINVFFISEKCVQFNYIRMVKKGLYFDFSYKLN